MACLQSLRNDISKFFHGASLRLESANHEIADVQKFNSSPVSSVESPLDKPLPQLPTLTDLRVTPMNIPSLVSRRQPSRPAPLFVSTEDARQLQFSNALSSESFIDSYFADKDILFGSSDDGYGWKLARRVSEISERYSPDLLFASATYECTQIKGRVQGPQAYMKVYMQIPSYCKACKKLSAKPIEQPQWISNEVAALRCMSQLPGETPAPRLLAMKTKMQSKRQWVPGGFLTFIVMQKMPGEVLNPDIYWDQTSSEQTELKQAFRDCLRSLWQAGVLPRNYSVQAISWDAATKTCYILDLRGAESIKYPPRWWDYEFYRWGLAKSSFEPASVSAEQSEDCMSELTDQKIRTLIKRAATKRAFNRKRTQPAFYELAVVNG